MAFTDIQNDWTELLKPEFEKPYFKQLAQTVNTAYKTQTAYPPAKLVFNAFKLCSLAQVKVVIIGQDPYHQVGQANGLCFSVNDGIRIPPSLMNIFKELKTDIPNFELPQSGNLEKWAAQGVLLLNAILTVEAGKPGSHKDYNWQTFTDTVIKLLSDQKENLVFLLWGNFAMAKRELIDGNKHFILTAAHPSPLARGAYFGSKHFSKTNNYLISKGIAPVNWLLT